MDDDIPRVLGQRFHVGLEGNRVKEGRERKQEKSLRREVRLDKEQALTMGALSGEMEALGALLRKALSARTVEPPTLKISGASLGFTDFSSLLQPSAR